MSPSHPIVKEGTLWVGGEPLFLLAGEYPYYRDDPRLWSKKLRELKRAGLNTVSFYIPWRHHELDDQTIVFDGDGNRNLVRFIQEIAECGLYAFAKPGPFVHAELPLGGLPNRVSPSFSVDRIAALSAAGEPLRSHGLELPSANDTAFVKDTHEWLQKAGRVLTPFQYPAGPLIAVQIGNEGFYCESPLPVDALDYSEPAAAAFTAFAGLRPPRRWSQPERATDLVQYIAWGEWLARSLSIGMEALSTSLGLKVPSFCNYSPPKGSDFDAWYLKLEKTKHTNVAYGYSSWAGNVIRDDAALVRYLSAASVNRGPNLEENWSLDWVDPECRNAAVPIYHALLGIACGATGLNVYTACATGEWDDRLHLDGLERPYGGAAPVGIGGECGEKAEALAVFTHFLNSIGPGLLRTSHSRDVTLVADTAYSAIGGWRPSGTACGDGFPIPPSIEKILPVFVRECLSRNITFSFQNLSQPLPDGPIVVVGGSFLREESQRRLAERAEQHRSVTILGKTPEWDEHFKPCRILAETHVPTCAVPDPQAKLTNHLTFRLASEDSSDLFLFLFSRTDEVLDVETRAGTLLLQVKLGARCCAAVRVTEGRLSAFYVSGPPLDLRTGTDSFQSTDVSSFAAVRRGAGFDIRSHRIEPQTPQNLRCV